MRALRLTNEDRESMAIRAALEFANALARRRRAAEQRDAEIMANLRALAAKLNTRGRLILYAFHGSSV